MAPARKLNPGLTHQISKAISYTDNGSAVTIGTVPAGAVIMRATAIVTTAFNAGTSNVLDIGTTADPDGFATDIALGTVGNIEADEMATTNDQVASADTDITATVALSGTAATAGAAYVVVEYIAEVG